MADSKKPFHETVAEKLIEQLKAGTAPWQMPWDPGNPNDYLPHNPTTGNRYKGINAVYLMAQGRSDARWMTYKQAAAVGAQVRRGEKGTPVQYWKFSEEQNKLDDKGKPILDAQGKPVKISVQLERPRVFFATVFNGEQIDGLPVIERKPPAWNALERAEHILQASGATIQHAPSNRAFYRPSTDSIHMPDKGQFETADNYYATVLHELGHWTGHGSRLDRDLSHPFGSDAYAKEELRAEIASMLVGDELGIGHDPGQHVSYVGSWIKALQDDPLEIFRASADAEKIYGYVMGFEQQQVQDLAASEKRPHELTLAEFKIQAKAEKLIQHGRQWEVSLGDSYFAFSDAESQEAAIADVHRAAVNNALYLNSPQASLIEIKPTIPTDAVMQDYPDLAMLYRQVLNKENTMEEIPSAEATQNAYQAELGRLLALSTITPAAYTPSDQVKSATHAAVFVNESPVILCGPADDPASLKQAEALSACSQAQAAFRAAGLEGAIHYGQVAGNHVPWNATETAIAAKISGQVESGGEDGPLVAIILKDPHHALATSLCVNTETAQIFDPNAPVLDDGKTLAALARGESAPSPDPLALLKDDDMQRRIAEQQQRANEQPAQGQETSVKRTYINVPYREKNDAKSLGARWDRQKQSWFIPPGIDPAPFAKWAQPAAPVATTEMTGGLERVYLAVPYGERGAAKAAGARWDKSAKSWYAGAGADMEQLKRWLPENVPDQQGPALSPREEFADALRSVGCLVDGRHPIMDGNKHRVAVEGDKKGEKAGFYVGHLDGHPAGYIKNNRTGVEMTWKSKGSTLDPAEKAKLQAEAAAKLAARAAEQTRVQEACALRIARQMDSLTPAKKPTAYHTAKGIQIHSGVLTDKAGLKTYIPAIDADEKIWTMQYIQEDGTKRFAKDSRKEGCFHPIGGMDAVAAAPILVIGEGYATASTLAEAMGQATIAAFDSGNLPAVARALHEKYPDKPIIIAGDDDKHQVITHGTNPGRTKAEEAAKAVGGTAIFPTFAPGESTYPDNLPPITPKTFRAHERAKQRLDAAATGKVQLTDQETDDLKRALLGSEQLEALAGLKAHTDFNDLATRSTLGREGVERQARAALSQAVQSAGRHQSRETVAVQERQVRRGVRIG